MRSQSPVLRTSKLLRAPKHGSARPSLTVQLISRCFIAALAAGVLLIAAPLAGCADAPHTGKTGSRGLRAAADSSAAATGTLVVGFDQAYPPYGYVGDDGEYTGFDLDLAAAVAERRGWELKLEPIDWDAKDALLESGAINCIWNGFTKEGREDGYTFSEPYMSNAQVIVARAGDGITTQADLAGKVVVTQVDSAAEEVLENNASKLAATFASLDAIGEYNTAFMQLESGAVDAVACDLSIARYQLAARPEAYIMLDDYLSEESYAVGFKKGDTATAEQVTETLKELYGEGAIEELCARYANQGLSFDTWKLK